MGSDTFDDPRKSARFNRVMIWNYLVVFPILLGGDTDMGATLPVHGIAQDTEGFDELRPANIAGQFYRARTSSRTKWSRITRGASMVSSK